MTEMDVAFLCKCGKRCNSKSALNHHFASVHKSKENEKYYRQTKEKKNKIVKIEKLFSKTEVMVKTYEEVSMVNAAVQTD